MHRFDQPMIPEVPELELGVTLLDVDNSIMSLHSLVVDRLILDGGDGPGSTITATPERTP